MAVTSRTLQLLRAMRTAVGGYADDAVRDLAAQWVKAWDQIAPTWGEAVNVLVAWAVEHGRWPTPVELARIEPVRQALADTDDTLDGLAVATTAVCVTAAGLAIAATAAAEPEVIASQLPAAYRQDTLRLVSRRILPSALDVIRARTQQAITAQTRPLSADASAALRRELIRGVQVGANPRVTARRMVASVNGAFNGGLNRATVIARTETLDAYRTASRYAHDANADVLDGWTWMATVTGKGATRTCPACWSMHGREFPVETSGPNGHQQCVPAGVEVFGPQIQASTTRWFVGQLVEIRTAGGRHLSVTPNHPVLTTEGWVSAGDLNQGCYVVCARPRERGVAATGSTPHDYQRPAFIEDVARSFDRPGLVGTIVVPTAPVDFHGDGSGSDVHVVRADSLLLNDIEASIPKPLRHHPLFVGHMRGAIQPSVAHLPRLGGGAEIRERLRLPALRGVRSLHDPAVLRNRPFGCPELIAFGHSTKPDTGIRQPSVDGASRAAHRLRYGVAGLAADIEPDDVVAIQRGPIHSGGPSLFPTEGPPVVGKPEKSATLEFVDQWGRAESVPSRGDLARFAGEVVADRIVEISRRDFSGHVYNLQTADGWYSANEIVTHNCRCARMPKVTPWSEIGIDLDEPADAFPDRQTAWDALTDEQQAAVMGANRLALLKSGRIGWDDLAIRRDNPAWRTSYTPRPLGDLNRIADQRR